MASALILNIEPLAGRNDQVVPESLDLYIPCVAPKNRICGYVATYTVPEMLGSIAIVEIIAVDSPNAESISVHVAPPSTLRDMELA